MCGIVGAAARREVPEILLEGLRRLEYRGYDSAGLATLDSAGRLASRKEKGKVAALEELQRRSPLSGRTGIAHTRWATHGEPSRANAHPHLSGAEVALVHNGIIENFQALKSQLETDGYQCVSATDSEVVVHLVHQQMKNGSNLVAAVTDVVARLDGAYALALIAESEPEVIVAARSGSPLVIGVGIGENFIASDPLALRQVTDRFIYLEEGDIAVVQPDGLTIYDTAGEKVTRPIEKLSRAMEYADKGEYGHFMLKEIYEQPEAINNTVAGRIKDGSLLPGGFDPAAEKIFSGLEGIQIVACGTSYHAGLVARYWLEDIAGVHCDVEVASEYRYRRRAHQKGRLLLTISQSGETADTLAALRNTAPGEFLASMAIVNVANSSLARESDLVFITEAGTEIGVASTKAFTTQLVALLLMVLTLARLRGNNTERLPDLTADLSALPSLVLQVLQLDARIQQVSRRFAEKHHALFLGRGIMFPIALEGALKLKEISYIHAEAYPAGELKHGPLALVDSDMPVIAVAPGNELLEKLKSNLEEVRARGGELYVFADADAGFIDADGVTVIAIPHCPEVLTPVIYTVVLQLLAYHVAVLRGTDVDQPRNLAKSVTVE
ncbi:MAG: glucosamine--fructose-6-phosphate aminotransferase (isomerizing) [Halieaceae bacterium]|jgi:glucosamine--fructose-6-phosphate aminotransferase (isomerizing)